MTRLWTTTGRPSHKLIAKAYKDLYRQMWSATFTHLHHAGEATDPHTAELQAAFDEIFAKEKAIGEQLRKMGVDL